MIIKMVLILSLAICVGFFLGVAAVYTKNKVKRLKAEKTCRFAFENDTKKSIGTLIKEVRMLEYRINGVQERISILHPREKESEE